MAEEREAKILAQRWCLHPKAVATWMKAREFKTVMNLMVFGSDHQEAMDKALADFWTWATE